jgi:hypothetical protein
MSAEDFDIAYEKFVNDVVKEFNWHVHKATCFKYCSPKDPHDDEHCRMRIDGSTCAETCLDEETLSILLRRLHPRIANYNDLCSF